MANKSKADLPTTIDQMPSIPQQQMAFLIFEELGLDDRSITESTSDIGFTKSNSLIEVTDLTLLSRRAINALYFIAQENPHKETFDVDVGYFKWLTNFTGSRNNIHLKKALRETQKAAIQVSIIDSVNPADDTYGSVPLLGPFVISRGRLTFKLPDEIKRQLTSPTESCYLSLRVGAGFSSGYAYELYERLLPFKDEKETPWIDVDTFRDTWMKAGESSSYKEYKFLKRDVLVPSVRQINAISDLSVTLEEKRTWRSITHIRFMVRRNMEFIAKFTPYGEALQQKYDLLRTEFGLSNDDFDEILEQREIYTDKRIDETIELLRFRREKQQIRRPAAYFMSCLKQGLVLSDTEKDADSPKRGQKADPAIEDRRRAKAKEEDNAKTLKGIKKTISEVSDVLESITESERTAIWAAYLASMPGKSALKRAELSNTVSLQEGLQNVILAPGFAAYVSQKAKTKPKAKASAA